MEQRSEPTGWVGWISFAGIMLIIGGIFSATYGLIAILNDTWAVWGNRGTMYLDLTQWGWLHLIVGVVVILAGIGVLSGNILARTIVVCASGARASLAALTLKTMGYEDVAVLDGGLKAWTDAGLPTNEHEYAGI